MAYDYGKEPWRCLVEKADTIDAMPTPTPASEMRERLTAAFEEYLALTIGHGKAPSVGELADAALAEFASAEQWRALLNRWLLWHASIVIDADWSGETPRLTQDQVDVSADLARETGEALNLFPPPSDR